MVATLQHLSRLKSNRPLHQFSPASSRLSSQVQEVEDKLHRIQTLLALDSGCKEAESKLNEVAQLLLSRKSAAIESGKYDELKKQLLVCAAVAGVTLIAFTNKFDTASFVSPAPPSITHVQSVSSPSLGAVQTKPTQNIDQVTALMRAIIGQESAGKFNIVNPHSGALGYGQVMSDNVHSWSLEALGYALTPNEFLQSPKLQLKIIKFKLEQYLRSRKPSISEQQKIREAAAIWYSGQAKLWNNTRPQFYNGHSYPSIAEYTQSVWEKYQKELGVKPAPVVPQQKKSWGNGLLNFFNSATPQQDVLATKIVGYMRRQGYQVFTHPQEVNIVHIRNGSTAQNLFEDTRLVIQFNAAGQPRIVGQWEETTKPGLNLIKNPVNPKGAITIQPGQYQAWEVGLHVGMSGRHAHEALVQVRPIKGLRDSNRDRVFDTPDAGLFWVNIHEPWSDGELVSDRSAGCMVTKTKAAHREFMQIVKRDRRYRADPQFVFTSTIIDSGDL